MFLNTLLSGVIYIIKTIFNKIPSLFFILIIMANKHIGITSLLRLLFVGVFHRKETLFEVKGQNIIGIIISVSPMMVTWYWNEEKHLWKHFFCVLRQYLILFYVCVVIVMYKFLFYINIIKNVRDNIFHCTRFLFTHHIFTWARQISLCILLPPRCVSQCVSNIFVTIILSSNIYYYFCVTFHCVCAR